MRNTLARRLAVVAVATAATAVTTLASAQASVHPASRDVAGTQLVRTTLTSRWGSAQAWLEHIDLTDRRLHIEPVLAHNIVDGLHETVPAMAQRTRAVVGINGDFWNWAYDDGPPLRGLWISGHMYKTPGYPTSANFYTTTDGAAHIGKVNVFTTMSWRTASGAARNSSVFSMNNYDDMLRGRLVVVTSDMATFSLPRCTVASLASTTRGWKVTGVQTRVRALARRTSTQRALVACRTPMPLAAGERIQWAQRSTVTGIDALVSGGGQLIRNGRAFRDQYSQLPTNDFNPMTFACVSRDSRHVTLGVVDGRRSTSIGTTPALLTTYLLKLGGCWNAMSFDGGASTTMYARGTVQNKPSNGYPRPVADGLFVYRS
ncbi:MAG TPA: phosphodiester glycosidase family protein [Jatrophihabitans sp.]|jgi:exopolysaccharide biosynthesis protein